jgi:PAS domain S-box-containing protein
VKYAHDLNGLSEKKVLLIDHYLQDHALHVVSAMGEGVALLDRDGLIQKVNPAFADLTEYEADELEGRTIHDVLPDMFEENAAVIEETLGRVSLKQGAPDKEDALQMITPKGTARWLVPSLSPIESVDGTTLALVLTLRDITALVKSQQARMQSERAHRDRLRQLSDRLASTKEQERREVATQLHDTVIQSLSLCSIRLGALRERVIDEQPGPDLSGAVDEIRQIVDTALVECRHMLGELTPPLLYELGLGAALNHMAEKYALLAGTRIQVRDELSANDIDSSLLGLLFESVRELVANAVKHAGDCLITVNLKREGSDIVAEVRDEGAGFEAQDLQEVVSFDQSGFGLFNVYERLLHEGGVLVLDSAPGRGTAAIIRVPSQANE